MRNPIFPLSTLRKGRVTAKLGACWRQPKNKITIDRESNSITKMTPSIFSQGLCVLFREAISLDELEGILPTADHFERIDDSTCWPVAGPMMVFDSGPHADGKVAVDMVDRPWPDGMGDPESDADVFHAWSTGHFGPITFPGSLRRAIACCQHDNEVKHLAAAHRAFIRIRATYVAFGATAGVVVPANYDAAAELLHLAKLCDAVMKHEKAVGFFNPNGEILCDRSYVRHLLELADTRRSSIWPLVANTRHFRLNDELAVVDTVGNEQLGAVDVEVVCSAENSATADFPELRARRCHPCGWQPEGRTSRGTNSAHWRRSMA